MRRRWLTMAGLAVATLSCQLIIGLEEPSGLRLDPEVDEAGVDAGPKDPCAHSLPPKLPAKDDSLDIKNVYWFAAQSVTAPLKGGQGFDIDNSCTCGKDLKDGGPSCVSSKTVCDHDGGVDDSLGSTFDEARNIPGGLGVDAVKPINTNLQEGARTLLFYVSDYNGLENDTDVRVAFVNSGGLYTQEGCTDGVNRPLVDTYHDFDVPPKRTPAGMDRYAPAYDGCDRWAPEEGSFVMGSRTPKFLKKGWVNKYQLVVPIDTVVTSIFGNVATIQGALFVAKITTEAGHFRMDGIIAGRMPFNDLYQAIGGNQVGDGNDAGYTAVCEKPEIWGFALQRLCQARDVMATEAEDFKGRNCDAASLNIGFVMIESKIATFDFTNPSDKKTCTPVIPCP